VVLKPLAAQYLAKDPSLAGLFVVYGLVVLANLIAESSTGLLQIFDRFRPIAILGLVGNIVTLALVVLVYAWHGSLLGVLRYLIGKAGALGLS
jgi:O-antigen/teichoic acid export membrane protein